MTQEQLQAIETLQDAHGAILGMMDYLKEDAPPWVAANAKKAVNESAKACKVTSEMMENEKSKVSIEDAYCENCKFCNVWYTRSEDEEGMGRGSCRRYAPRPSIGKELENEDPEVNWPTVAGHHWCGEYEPQS